MTVAIFDNFEGDQTKDMQKSMLKLKSMLKQTQKAFLAVNRHAILRTLTILTPKILAALLNSWTTRAKIWQMMWSL